LKSWVKKFINQFDISGNSDEGDGHMGEETPDIDLSEDRATILYIIDTYLKHLIDIERFPIRKARITLEELAQELIKPDHPNLERVLFKTRQFFSSYRIGEYSYIQKTFDDFRNIIWDFVEQLNEGLDEEQAESEVKNHFERLREAVESNSIDTLKSQSRQFIDSYIELQYRRDKNKSDRMEKFQKNLHSVQKQLVEANQAINQDHLTKAFNRRSFDEHIKKQWQLSRVTKSAVTLVMVDIDHFKRVNDTYGHDIGDAIIKECVKLLQDCFQRDLDFVARVGGEEFAVVMSDFNAIQAAHACEKALQIIRDETYVHLDMRIKFTCSMGVAQLQEGESVEEWSKRADEALYSSKHSGRDRMTVAENKKAKAS
jgi:diguanylate cyclase